MPRITSAVPTPHCDSLPSSSHTTYLVSHILQPPVKLRLATRQLLQATSTHATSFASFSSGPHNAARAVSSCLPQPSGRFTKLQQPACLRACLAGLATFTLLGVAHIQYVVAPRA